MDGFDCLGATDTTDDFSTFLKKEGINLMSKTADQLSKDDKGKKPTVENKKKPAASSNMTLAMPIVGGVCGIGGGALLWKAHRVWGGLLGGIGGGALGRIAGMFF